MTEFWLVSAPGENTPQKTWDRLNQATAGPEKLSVNYKFSIPELRVGTLDVLVGLSDDLGKLDTYCEGVTRKLAQYLGEVLEDTRDKLAENLKVGDGTPTSYLHKFTWDGAKYPIKQSLRFLADMIGKQVSQIEADLKNKSSAYNNLKGNLQNLERKATGSLLTRSLADLVKKTDFVLDSEYLITLLVIVPKSAQSEWLNKYEKLTDMVVPRSSRLLFEDQESCLFNVTLFQRAVDEFKHHCRENKFVVRDFVYNEKEIEEGKTEVTRLEADKKKQYGPLVKWLRINFGECFAAWIHVKALRVFVESVLRYGLPVNFQAMIMLPNKRSQKRLREVLNQLYSHLDTTSMSGSDGSSMEIPGLNLGSADYYPYVFYRINLDLLDSQRL
ncbi:V-type proton ATPase subunit C 1-A-like [Pomacea canaliculata]|uniref:V-type proton ATPase subunit C 1-A-like n=1 Tax=Pomacea canaliculata TaxID=400727 RepID=UPI000D733CC7|nr:V-type proton ATPase subunit C 1-A-like [Pomacea canaliculata]